jgi:uncharacterized membrane protein YfcA
MIILQTALILTIGLVAGISAGMFGLGGGAIIVPAMMYLVGFQVKTAMGTSLMTLVLPVGVLGAIEYYKQGNVDIKAVLLLTLGLFIGTLFGAKFTLSLPDVLVRRLFGIFLLLISVRYLTAR